LLATGLAQTAPQGSSSPAFQSQAKLVLVPFSVARDKLFVAGLRSSDIELFEDGRSRSFNVFEGPATGRRLPLELALLFDTTTPFKSQRRTHWNREATYKFTSRWNDAASRAILEHAGADVRISVYHFDQNQMERLCRSTNDPQELATAFRRLLSPISGSSTMPLVLLPNGHALSPNDPISFSPGWIMEASIATMKDSVTSPDNAMRMLVVFSEGKGGTDTSPEYLADQARELGIPVFNVVLDYEKPQVPFASLARSPEDPLMNYFEDLAESTGGHLFFPSHIDDKVIGGILEFVRNQGLPQYVAGFVPESADPKLHSLEIRLKAKSNRRLIGGKRKAAY
jgi:VWFA-related protein